MLSRSLGWLSVEGDDCLGSYRYMDGCPTGISCPDVADAVTTCPSTSLS